MAAASRQMYSSCISHISTHPTDSSQDYKWGFSFLQLYLMILIMWILSCGVWTLHISTTFELRHRNKPPLRVGEYKAVLKLAERVSHDFNQISEDPGALHEAGIRRRIRKQLRGGAVTYQASLVEELQTGSSWRQEKWWIGGTLLVNMLAFLLNSTAWFYAPVFCMSLIAPATGCVLATSIGTTLKSRGLMVLICTIVVGVILIIVMIPAP